ncbi:MAG TPA: hypothetical protein VMR19_03210 [Candidatus Saccharimonadales bacterium]|nr:hypothetical protein [Candidatus Saccharimonadales bacterium]
MGWGIKFIAIYILCVYFTLVFCSVAKATIVFSISNPVVDADDQLEIDASISGLISSSCSTGGCYLQAELQSAGGYFGYTYNNSGEFVDYFKSPGSTDEIKSKLFNFIPVTGAWSGKLKAKNNPQNSNYYGPGNYLLTFRRFSGNSTSPTSGDSNSLSVSLTAVLPTPTLTDTPQSTPTPEATSTPFTLKTPAPTSPPSPTLTPTSVPIKTSIPTPLKTQTPPSAIAENISSDSGSIPDVLGVQDDPTVSDLPYATESEKVDSPFPFLAVGLTALGLGFVSFSIFSIIKSVKKSYTIKSEKENNQVS